MQAPMFGCHRCRGFIRAILPARCPQYDHLATFDLFQAQHWEVGWLNGLASRQQFELNPVELMLGKASRRKNWLTVGIAILPNHHIATAQIFKVVGEGDVGTVGAARIAAIASRSERYKFNSVFYLYVVFLFIYLFIYFLPLAN